MSIEVSVLWRGDYKAPMPPKGDVRITYFTANCCLSFESKISFFNPTPCRDFVPGPVAVEVWDTNHWATMMNWNNLEENSNLIKVPDSGIILQRIFNFPTKKNLSLEFRFVSLEKRKIIRNWEIPKVYFVYRYNFISEYNTYSRVLNSTLLLEHKTNLMNFK